MSSDFENSPSHSDNKTSRRDWPAEDENRDGRVETLRYNHGKVGSSNVDLLRDSIRDCREHPHGGVTFGVLTPGHHMPTYGAPTEEYEQVIQDAWIAGIFIITDLRHPDPILGKDSNVKDHWFPACDPFVFTVPNSHFNRGSHWDSHTSCQPTDKNRNRPRHSGPEEKKQWLELTANLVVSMLSQLLERTPNRFDATGMPQSPDPESIRRMLNSPKVSRALQLIDNDNHLAQAFIDCVGEDDWIKVWPDGPRQIEKDLNRLLTERERSRKIWMTYVVKDQDESSGIAATEEAKNKGSRS